MTTAFASDVYAFLKPAIDAHTLGLISASELLIDCKYEVHIAKREIQEAIMSYRNENALAKILNWLKETRANHFALTYRLDGQDASMMLGYIIEAARRESLFHDQGGSLRYIYYAGLPDACEIVKNAFKDKVRCFSGGESPRETLELLMVPEERIPKDLLEAGQYDLELMRFGQSLIKDATYKSVKPYERDYLDFGTSKDGLIKRLNASTSAHYIPIIRAHVGPYNADLTREENVNTFLQWAKELAKAGFLDVLSVGSSQLTQSHFGESWDGMLNGGGVPLATKEEFRSVWEAARPMLLRTYAGTKDMASLASLYEETIHIAWHAMSFWWFNRLDDRGPYTLYESLKQQMAAIDVIARYGTPFEANVSHHFAFRGSDDTSYIVSSYLAAKYAKSRGIKTFVLQNMLGTPRSTWAICDIAKSRALLRLLRTLEEPNFKIVFQPRAGLDYFKPDLDTAKAQLAAISALMDDIEPHDETSPEMIHVVSYSEAAHLADPAVINESIQITRHAIAKWRELRKQGLTMDTIEHPEILALQTSLYNDALAIVEALERFVPDLYTAEGFYIAFAAGFMPVPYLWRDQEEFSKAILWKTKVIRGRVVLVNEQGRPLDIQERIGIARTYIQEAAKNLGQQMPKGAKRLMYESL